MRLWKNRTMMRMGTVTTIAAAAIDPVGWLNCEAPGNSAIAAGTVCAAFVSMALPLVVFFALQRYFVRGLLAGSVKG